MNTKYLDMMVRADTGKRRLVYGRLRPVYFDEDTFNDVSKHFDEITEVCRRMWTFMGYSGLILPWHEFDPRKELNFQRKSLQKWFVAWEKLDVSVASYCVLCCSVSDYTKHERPSLLLYQTAPMSWVAKLRKHAGSSELVDRVVTFLYKFFELQFDRAGTTYINPTRLSAADPSGKGKYFETYHKIVDRLKYFDLHGVDSDSWLEKKFDSCFQSFEDRKIYINTMVNVNSFDPDLKELSSEMSDPWRSIRRFLQLPDSCEFPDGYIPKGWGIASDDPANYQNIARVMGDGFYYYKDGTQRRGKRHYASNRYFIIKCDHSNFDEFKSAWNRTSLISVKPTWLEYKKWAMFPGVWDEKGESLVNTKDIKWRKS